jgi:subtilisin family serine protease
MKTKLFFAALLFIGIAASYAGTDKGNKAIAEKPGLKTWDKTLMLKLKSEFRSLIQSNGLKHPAADRLFAELQTEKFFKRFPHRLPPKDKFHFTGEVFPDMSLIFQLQYQNGTIPVKEAARLAMNSGLFEYAEPKYIRETVLIPNDQRLSQQYYLDSIQAYQAWDITQGDTNVVLGIIDSGVQTNHSDLSPQIKFDPTDPTNGLDDNNDGYIDNNRGWDFCGPTTNFNYAGDNNPNITQGNASHGTHVAGITAAATNNGIGIAGVAYKCKIMPLKCSPDDGGQSILFGYEAIEYGASHGCDVLNCSWGGAGGYSTYEQEVITDATLTYNCLVVAAAGNDNSPDLFYPAYYDHVLAVSALGPGNVRANFTNYNYKVRVAAPGVNIMSTYYNNAYQNNSGTSMASPVVAGVAGLVKSWYPDLTPDQIAQKIRVSSDNVYTVPGNTQTTLFGKLGKGIVNAYRALVEISPGIKNLRVRVTDNNNNLFQPGDTLYITADFINYLLPSSANLKVRFSVVTGSNSIYVTQVPSTQDYVLGEMTGNQIKNNNGAPFKIYLKPNLPTDRIIDIRMRYTDGTYDDYDHTSILLNPTYINVQKNNISTTVSSKGRIGWNNDLSSEGLGFQHKSRQTLYELGLMTGNSVTKVANTVRNTTTGATASHDDDYRNINFVKEVTPPAAAVSEYNNLMSDANAGTSAANVNILQRTFAATTPGDSNHIIVQYKIVNRNATPLSNYHVGLFGDFDISASGQQDKASWSEAQKLGYTYNSNPDGLYAGVAVLGNATPHYYAIDNDATAADTFGVYDGFSDQEKWTGMTSGLYRRHAGVSTAKDVSMIIGSGPYTIAPNDTLTVGFAVVAGENLQQIQNAAQEAQNEWPNLVTSGSQLIAEKHSGIKVYPNPARGEVYVMHNIPNAEWAFYNTMGRRMDNISVSKTEYGSQLEISTLPAGVYILRSDAGSVRIVKE